MGSNTGFIWNPPSALRSVYYHQTKEDPDDFIDLGLSLRTLEPYHPSAHEASPRSNGYVPKEEEGESKERWGYVKVNMDGVVVGRKICMPHHAGYSNLARELEDMFGRQTESGLRLFQSGSQFSLFYMDRDENWRSVGDVSWKEFVNSVKRLRIKPIT